MAWMMPAKAQHPFILTTADDVTNHTETLYWIESKGATGFYMIPMEIGDDKGVSTSNMPNKRMLWFFMDAGIENNIQYYYIGNKSTGRYLRLKGANGADGSIGIKATTSLDDSYKFSISGSEGQWVFSPKSGSTYYVNKKGSNVNYTSGLKSSATNDANSKWNFVAESDVTWAHPFINSIPSDKHYYLIQNRHKDYTSFYMSTDASSFVTVSDEEDDNRAWYFVEASSDDDISNMKYYYIVNAVTGKYMYFNGTASGFQLNNVFMIQTHSGGDDDRYQFAIVNAVGTGYNAFAIMPKSLISLYQNKYTSLGTSSMESGQHIGTLRDRGLDDNKAHWVFEVYVAVEAPTITNDDGTITLSTTTPGATIYYTTNGDTPDNTSTEYAEPFSVGDATVIKAIAYLGSDFSEVSTYNVPTSHDYSLDYLTLDIISSGTLKWKAEGSNATKTIEYSINDGDWTSVTSTTAGVTIDVVAGNRVRLRGTNTKYCNDNKNNYTHFAEGTATFDIFGNIMSLTAGENFANVTTLPGTWTFCQLFKESKCISAENLILPATTLTEDCYRAMFSLCTTLVTAPQLPATTLAKECYWYMFECCAITTAPDLLATTLVTSCYGHMFVGCSNLNYIKCFATTGINNTNLANWVGQKNAETTLGVAETGLFVKDANASWSTGVSGIPTGWGVDNYLAAPDDPVITCDGDFITITCDTYGADIYYRSGQTGDYSLYSASIAFHENTVVEAYAEKNELRSDTISETCIAIKSYRFAGMMMTPGPLYFGSNGYEIKEGWNYNSYNSIYGKAVGSTYFNFIELGRLFESSVFSTSDGDIEKVLDPLDGWRVPTHAEWASILGTTRSGSTVNGSSNKHYAMIQLADVSGWLIFPDGETITGAALSNLDNITSNTGITEIELNNYLIQGCIFLPGSGYYEGQAWGNGHQYWSSTENNSSTGYVSSGDTKDKESCYFPVYLVKDTADEATRLLRTWTYDNNEVELPYSVNAIDGHSASYARGTFSFTTNVKVKETQPTYLWFQHADQSADIYVNNTKVETHWGGYNAFFTDITEAITPGTNNIRVTLNNTSRNILAPYAGDFNFNATLGEVKLISSPVVPTPDYGYDGFHITSTVTAEEATITVKTSVPTEATLTCFIKGDNCTYSETQTDTGEITFETTIPNPHLWNGILDPYLYDVTLTIAKDDVVYHTFKRGYGLRFFEYVVDNDAPENSRFMLNGSPYLLRGVCMHSDLEGKANALTAADIDNDFEILKELGCNFVRLAHYPHPKEVYDRCDKMGIIVQTEVPWVNKAESTLPNDYYTHLEGQYRDMVNQHYNHPSILFWGLSNETTTDDKDFAKGKINGYISLIKDLDSSRMVGYVMSHSVEDPSGYYNDPDADWFGCNIYVGWYLDPNSNNPTSRLNTRLGNILTRLHKPLAFSEYGCGGTQSCHSDDFMTTTTRGNNPRHDIEYQMWLHEGHIAAIKNHPQLLFTSQWQLFDIAVKNRQEGYKVCLDGGEETVFDNDEFKRLNNKGLVERDHKTKKDPFYLYKAWWNQTDKFVHICGKDYKKSTNRVIKCYTNDGSTLTLYVNDVEIQTVTVENNIATFTARNFNPGDVIRVNGDSSNDTFTMTNYNVFTTEGDWNVASNWTAGVVPDASYDVSITANATVPSGYTANAGNITLYGSTLTIADGGQLIHNNEGVAATVKKNIAAYGEIVSEGGWNFIASPLAGITPTPCVENLISNPAANYDLFYYDEAAHYWRNYKESENSANPNFNLNNGQGYLYANHDDVELQFEGPLQAGTDGVFTVSNLSYACGIESLKGFNLVGNPFACNATIDQSFYVINDGNLVANTGSTIIPPCTGVMVKTTESGQPVTFTKATVQQNSQPSQLQLTLTQQETHGDGVISTQLDNAIVSFDEDNQLGKFYFGTQNAKLYLPQNGKEFAIVSVGRDGAHTVSTMDVNFKANENGSYTIAVNPEGVEMSYLHLIDNMTGEDVDLLQTPEYSFKAKTTDYESRFKLVFVANNTSDDQENVRTQKVIVQ